MIEHRKTFCRRMNGIVQAGRLGSCLWILTLQIWQADPQGEIVWMISLASFTLRIWATIGHWRSLALPAVARRRFCLALPARWEWDHDKNEQLQDLSSQKSVDNRRYIIHKISLCSHSPTLLTLSYSASTAFSSMEVWVGFEKRTGPLQSAACKLPQVTRTKCDVTVYLNRLDDVPEAAFSAFSVQVLIIYYNILYN